MIYGGKMKNIPEYTASNQAAWNASAAAFEAGNDWRELLAQVGGEGFSVLDETLTKALLELKPEARGAGADVFYAGGAQKGRFRR